MRGANSMQAPYIVTTHQGKDLYVAYEHET